MKKEPHAQNCVADDELLKQIEASLIFQFQQLHNTIFRVANQMIELSSVPIKIEQLPVLMTVFFNKGKSQQEVASLVNRDKSSVFRTARALEKKGLLAFKKDESDARRKILELTDTGKFVAIQVGTLMKKIENEIADALSNRPKEEFLEELKTATEKIENLTDS